MDTSKAKTEMNLSLQKLSRQETQGHDEHLLIFYQDFLFESKTKFIAI